MSGLGDWISDQFGTVMGWFMTGVGAWVLAGMLGILGWFVTAFVAQPLRPFFDLRSQVSETLLKYPNESPITPENARTPSQKREAGELYYRFIEARDAFRDLGAKMLAFAETEGFARRVVTILHMKPERAGQV